MDAFVQGMRKFGYVEGKNLAIEWRFGDEKFERLPSMAAELVASKPDILLDIDHFKSVNDTHGHQAGDQVLIAIAKLLTQGTREVDTIGRWGGEEFLVICPDTDADGAIALAQKLRQLIANHSIPVVGRKTSSFGVASYKADESIEALLARADKALYRSKENGRNRVECEA